MDSEEAMINKLKVDPQQHTQHIRNVLSQVCGFMVALIKRMILLF